MSLSFDYCENNYNYPSKSMATSNVFLRIQQTAATK